MSVSTGPGYTPITRVPCPARSMRAPCVKEWIAAFDAEYVGKNGNAVSPPTEETLTTAPPPLRASTGADERISSSGAK